MSATRSPELGMGSSLVQKFNQSMYSGKLEISNMRIRNLPRDVEEFDISDICFVDLSCNKFTEVPPEVLKCSDVEEINCYNNMMRSITDLTSLRFLCRLNLRRNQLTSFPVNLCDLPLEELYLSNNKIHCFPPEIGKLTKLIDFDISSNMFSSIPPEFGNLESLKDLNVRNNFITHIPSELTQCPLVRLDLSYNRIAIIPPSYRFLKDLQHLDISNNPLVCPPAQYVGRGRVHIFKLLEILVWQQEQKDLIKYEQMYRRKKEEERQRLNFASPRRSSTSTTFINDLLVSWDTQATATMLEDPFFKKELEKDKIYREKYGIKDDYMKRSLQVAQGRGINTINRTQGKGLAKQLTDKGLENSAICESAVSSAPSVDKTDKLDKKKRQKDTKSKSPSKSRGSPNSVVSNDSSPSVKSKSSSKVTSETNEDVGLDDIFLDKKKETTLERSKRAVSFSVKNVEVIPPAPESSPPQSDEEKDEAQVGAFTMQREDAKQAQIHYQEDFIKNLIARYLNIVIKDVDESLKDGVILCQVLNVMRKNAVRRIMTPQGNEPLSTMKATVNVNSFLRFAKMNLGQDKACNLSDIQHSELTPIYDTLKALSEKFPYQSEC